MSFQAFENAIVSPSLKNVAKNWNFARGSRRMPSWASIKPAPIVAELPIVWSYTYDRATDTFTGRLAGDAISQIFGKDFRGLPMRQAYPKEEFPRLFAFSKRVIDGPALYRGAGMVFKHIDRHGVGERIIMPLSDDGMVGDGIFGATQYQTIGGGPTEVPEEFVEWFSL